MNEQRMNRLSECKMTAFSVVAVAPHGLSLLYHFLKCVSFQILFTFFELEYCSPLNTPKSLYPKICFTLKVVLGKISLR
jgi:hypothetical protein